MQGKNGRWRTGWGRTVYSAAAMLLVGLLCAAPSLAAPDRSYQAVRDWLEQYRHVPPSFQPGEHLTFNDIERLKPFIPQPAWEFYFFPDMDMEIAATGTYPPPPDWGKNMVSGYYLDEQGALIGFNGGGWPFPAISPDDPQAALKVFWNMYWRPGHSDYFMPMVAWGRGVGGTLSRQWEFVSTAAEYAKGDYCLVPGYEGVKYKSIMEFRSPRDLAGARNLQIEYTNPYRENDSWQYSPVQRKPRRVLSSERTSETMGMDFIREDSMGFGGKVHEQHWTYLGKKWILATVNVPTHPDAGGPHLWVPHKTRWELRECHVLELVPKSPTHPYGHKLIFIDAEIYWTLWMTAYDRQDQLLRLGQDFLKYSESYATEEAKQAPYVKVDYSRNLGEHVFLHVGNTVINAQKPHATFTHCYVVRKKFSPGMAKQFYSVRNMVSGRR
ncbi:MAG: outer membrane lipoprotein-sorting protein [Thermodesulfobacteriota bacterium]